MMFLACNVWCHVHVKKTPRHENLMAGLGLCREGALNRVHLLGRTYFRPGQGAAPVAAAVHPAGRLLGYRHPRGCASRLPGRASPGNGLPAGGHCRVQGPGDGASRPRRAEA
ncbi:hypothetical protein DVU_3244 [Nitratidesulfovibrio vulgaris str. Hildenborough]|uniref:Uncharacterized protein n=1 Tax=Nitratidesulfovibrio vulgaris (strain ATCC 29579 / DSM 644 / CCUG 34227 / NCIMB 8303 / VKM B-1760 / Hildenborough) TaxID=882 RepID=Q725M5_NITV2|nr:hypothetical protein DVU_3244 [Nitratidesulfovibrio vulgaris str. Hildenborough]